MDYIYMNKFENNMHDIISKLKLINQTKHDEQREVKLR